MNIIKRIKIENIKGKEKWELSFDDFNANQPNIIVAPNGYGKSTLAVAFEAASSGKIKLKSKDYYMQNLDNHPRMEIELNGEHKGVYYSTDTEGGLSRIFTIYTINSPLYAKNTTRGFGGNTALTADLRVEDVVVFDKIPPKVDFGYSFSKIREWFDKKSKLFININDMLLSYDNIDLLKTYYGDLQKCCTSVTIQKRLSSFLSSCSEKGSTDSIKSSFSDETIDELYVTAHLKELLEAIEKMGGRTNNWDRIDSILTAIQICKLMQESNNLSKLKDVHKYLHYKVLKDTLNNRLKTFNTTGRTIKTHEMKNKLLVSFERANAMSNGERDVLSFIAHLTKFEVVFNKEIGILVIDEIFDYLDGSNLLAVQYYLSEMIKKYKDENKILFPIIFTHLDPNAFSNYYFKSKKIHYISCHSTINLNSPVVQMIRFRSKSSTSEDLKHEISAYYLHFNNEKHEPSKPLKEILDCDSDAFREMIYHEITEKYLSNSEIYDPLKVIIGIRLKIEELVFSRLQPKQQQTFLETHKTGCKLSYAEEAGINVCELFYLLQPLYNDGLHIEGKDALVKQKIKSCYLKTDNLHIKRMVATLFELKTAVPIL